MFVITFFLLDLTYSSAYGLERFYLIGVGLELTPTYFPDLYFAPNQNVLVEAQSSVTSFKHSFNMATPNTPSISDYSIPLSLTAGFGGAGRIGKMDGIVSLYLNLSMDGTDPNDSSRTQSKEPLFEEKDVNNDAIIDRVKTTGKLQIVDSYHDSFTQLTLNFEIGGGNLDLDYFSKGTFSGLLFKCFIGYQWRNFGISRQYLFHEDYEYDYNKDGTVDKTGVYDFTVAKSENKPQTIRNVVYGLGAEFSYRVVRIGYTYIWHDPFDFGAFTEPITASTTRFISTDRSYGVLNLKVVVPFQ